MRVLPLFLRRIIKTGQLTVHGPGGFVQVFGDGREPHVTMRITDPALEWRIARKPALAAAESFMDGTLTVDGGRIFPLLELFYLNARPVRLTARQIMRRRITRGIKRALIPNTAGRARRNASAHYDLSNAFYQLWLDEDLQYSCAYFRTGMETLDQAQAAKKAHIAAKLLLQPGQRVLDIGCGWGGLALYFAAEFGVEVTGVSLAGEQIALARQRAEAAGLADRVTFELMDYRAVTGQFDRIVSVGMVEHVGIGQLLPYFLTVRDRLAPGGVALIHSITAKSPPGTTTAFLDKYIFPGGYTPRLSESFAAIERAGLWTLDCELWRLHYASTLSQWSQRFFAVRDQVVAMKGESFARMWEFYLTLSELAFRYGNNMVYQLQLGHTRDAAPLTRDYLYGNQGKA